MRPSEPLTRFLPLVSLALLCSCASPPPAKAPSRPTPAHSGGSIEFPTSSNSSATIPAPRLRLEKPYAFGELPDRLEFSPTEIEGIKNDIRAWLNAAHVPEGEETVLYSHGVATLDHWLHYGPNPAATPPDKPSYYRLLYRDGHPFEAYRHDANGVRPAIKIYYAEGMIPVGSVSYDANGKPARYAHLVYDTRKLVKRVVVLDHTGKPVAAVCRAHRDVYLNDEYKSYSFNHDGVSSAHIVTEDSIVYRVENGERREINRGSLLRTITSLEKYGVRPLYPLPAGFVRPADIKP